METILIFDQAESSGGSISRVVDISMIMSDTKFIILTYHPLVKLYPVSLSDNIRPVRIFSFYNYQIKYRHGKINDHYFKNSFVNLFGKKLIALVDLINEYSVFFQGVLATLFTKIDLVQANCGVHHFPYHMANFKKSPLIYYFRHMDNYCWALGSMLNRASSYLFVGQNLMNRYFEQLDLPRELCHVVHSPFDANSQLSLTDPQDLSVVMKLKKSGKFIITHASRICEEKGQHIVLDAIVNIKDSSPEVILLFVGSFDGEGKSEYHSALMDVVIENGLTERVFFLGYRPDVLHIIQVSDIAIQAPLWFEALCGSMIESMQLGIPTICANIGGPAEVISHNENGLLFPVGDSDSLGRLIGEIVDGHIDATRLTKKGKPYAIEKFDPKKIKESLQQVYKMAIDEKMKSLI